MRFSSSQKVVKNTANTAHRISTPAAFIPRSHRESQPRVQAGMGTHAITTLLSSHNYTRKERKSPIVSLSVCLSVHYNPDQIKKKETHGQSHPPPSKPQQPGPGAMTLSPTASSHRPLPNLAKSPPQKNNLARDSASKIQLRSVTSCFLFSFAKTTISRLCHSLERGVFDL